MTIVELWFLFAVMSSFFWGFSGILAKYSTRRIGVARVALLIMAVEGLMYSIAYAFWHDETHVSLADAILATSSCVIGILGYIFYFESILQGQLSIAGTISAAYPVIAVVGAVLLLSESLSAVQMVGVVGIIGGVVALSYEPNPGSATALSRRSLAFALMSFLFWGFWSLTSKMAVDAVGPGNVFIFYVVAAMTAAPVYSWLRFRYPSSMPGDDPSRRAWAVGAIALAVNVGGAWAYTFALETGNASLVVPISSAYPLITVVLAIIIYRERVNRLQTAALAFILTGLVLLGMTV